MLAKAAASVGSVNTLNPVPGIRNRCSMYEVAPYTSDVSFTLESAGKQHLKHATPQIYARHHAYPSLSDYDVTTAVSGVAWTGTARVTLPKSGTWFVCVHVRRLLPGALRSALASTGDGAPKAPSAAGGLPITVAVKAQMLPHDECVEETRVSEDGQRVRKHTVCENEVGQLELRYAPPAQDLEGGVSQAGFSLPHFVLPGDGSAASGGLTVLHVSGGAMRYFSFALDPWLVGFALRIRLRPRGPASRLGDAQVCRCWICKQTGGRTERWMCLSFHLYPKA